MRLRTLEENGFPVVDLRTVHAIKHGYPLEGRTPYYTWSSEGFKPVTPWREEPLIQELWPKEIVHDINVKSVYQIDRDENVVTVTFYDGRSATGTIAAGALLKESIALIQRLRSEAAKQTRR